MIEWLIIGGGIHGTYLSNLLTAETGLTRDDIRVLDPHDRPLELWHRYARSCGMRYLRSPATHNIDIHILSLYRFAKSTVSGGGHFIPPYNRPSRRLFARHCESVIQQRGLSRMRIQGRARALVRTAGGIGVDTDTERIQSKRALLCIGPTETPCWPEWAHRARGDGVPIEHVFDREFCLATAARINRTVVIGGGLTAVQIALTLIRTGSPSVTILSPHGLRRSNFDFDPCWIGPKCMTGFLSADLKHRRNLIDDARMPGTLPMEVHGEVTTALNKGHIRFRQADVRGLRRTNGALCLDLEHGHIEANRVILATGFDPGRPAGALMDQTSREFSLRTDDGGFPVVDDHLRWGNGIFVSGPLAELRIGPCARNIVGARNAGRLLLEYLKNR